jgi:hypothetical protein
MDQTTLAWALLLGGNAVAFLAGIVAALYVNSHDMED